VASIPAFNRQDILHIEEKNPASTEDGAKPTKNAKAFKGSWFIDPKRHRDRQGNHILQFQLSSKTTTRQTTYCLFYLCVISRTKQMAITPSHWSTCGHSTFKLLKRYSCYHSC